MPMSSAPQIIRTIKELEKLDPDAVLMQHEKGDDIPYMDFQHVWLSDWAIDRANVFPLAVITTGEQVRAAQQTLKEQG